MADLNSVVQQLAEVSKRKTELERQQEETEQIMRLMQDHVDSVNSESTGTDELKRELQRCQQQLTEVPMMQQVVCLCSTGTFAVEF